MKRLLFSLLIFFGVSTMLYASFPVSETSNKQKTEKSVIAENSLPVFSAVRDSGPGFGIAALVCGIIGFFTLPFLLGPLAIIFGAIGLKKNRGKGMAIAGLILGILQVLLVIVLIIALAAFMGSGGGLTIY